MLESDPSPKRASSFFPRFSKTDALIAAGGAAMAIVLSQVIPQDPAKEELVIPALSPEHPVPLQRRPIPRAEKLADGPAFLEVPSDAKLIPTPALLHLRELISEDASDEELLAAMRELDQEASRIAVDAEQRGVPEEPIRHYLDAMRGIGSALRLIADQGGKKKIFVYIERFHMRSLVAYVAACRKVDGTLQIQFSRDGMKAEVGELLAGSGEEKAYTWTPIEQWCAERAAAVK